MESKKKFNIELSLKDHTALKSYAQRSGLKTKTFTEVVLRNLICQGMDIENPRKKNIFSTIFNLFSKKGEIAMEENRINEWFSKAAVMEPESAEKQVKVYLDSQGRRLCCDLCSRELTSKTFRTSRNAVGIDVLKDCVEKGFDPIISKDELKAIKKDCVLVCNGCGDVIEGFVHSAKYTSGVEEIPKPVDGKYPLRP